MERLLGGQCRFPLAGRGLPVDGLEKPTGTGIGSELCPSGKPDRYHAIPHGAHLGPHQLFNQRFLRTRREHR